MHDDLGEHFAALRAVRGRAHRTSGSFERYVWLAPEPRERFVELIAATCARYPAFPPYEGAGGEPEPHLTIAAIGDGDDAEQIAEIARSELSPLLPFRFAVTCVSLFEEQADGTFEQPARFRPSDDGPRALAQPASSSSSPPTISSATSAAAITPRRSRGVFRRTSPIWFPFRPVAAVDDALRAELTRHFSGLAPFAAELTGVGSFARHVWLAPEPRDRFVELMRRPASASRSVRRRGGAPRARAAPDDRRGPAGRGRRAARGARRGELEPSLPFAFEVAAVSLLEEGADGLWHELSRFELG